jgi:hypothetical protein
MELAEDAGSEADVAIAKALFEIKQTLQLINKGTP